MKRITKWLAVAGGLATASYAAYVATTWLTYGRPRRARGDAADALLDRFMREHDVVERHAVAVAAPADVTFATAKETQLDSSRIVRAIFKAREVILRAKPDAAKPAPRDLVEAMQAIGWGVLAETDRELVMGAVTKPWEANPVFRAIAPDAFAAFAEPDHVKIAWTLRADAAPDGSSVFRTETRAIATDAAARAKFRRYWALLSPGIILIREAMVSAVATAAERKTIEHHAEHLHAT